MKRLISAFLLLPLLSIAQKDPIDTVKFNYTSVETVDSISAKILQARARVFITENFKSPKDVVQLDDQDAGMIIVKGVDMVYIKEGILGTNPFGLARFTIKLQFKDGKYKYIISDFIHEGNTSATNGGPLENNKPQCSTFAVTQGYWRKVKTYVNSDMISFIRRLNEAMKKSDIGASKDGF